MYGLVNQGIQGLITENYGSAIWEKIKAKAGYEVMPVFHLQVANLNS